MNMLKRTRTRRISRNSQAPASAHAIAASVVTRPLRAQAVLSKGDGGGPDVATRYYERALPNLKEASAKLDAVVKLLPK